MALARLEFCCMFRTMKQNLVPNSATAIFTSEGNCEESATNTTSEIFLARSDDDILDCFPLFEVLRPHLDRERFLSQVRRQEGQGYHILALRHEGTVKSAAGFRFAEFLAWGAVLYIDDLVTLPAEKRHGYAGQLLDWLIQHARENACSAVHLDTGYTRHDAHRLYLRKGFHLDCHHLALALEPNNIMGERLANARMQPSASVLVRDAFEADAEAVAKLHAESWRSAYRGVLSDEYLQNDAHRDRLVVWRKRFSRTSRKPMFVMVAERASGLAGFVCVFPEEDSTFGAFLDNLHVAPGLTRQGIGRKLLSEAASRVATRDPRTGIYLWVIEGNQTARRFYEKAGAQFVGSTVLAMPDGQRVAALRCYWPDPKALVL
jgi:GNAT superfamily N-acetyltransferase